eukprot:293994_1
MNHSLFTTHAILLMCLLFIALFHRYLQHQISAQSTESTQTKKLSKIAYFTIIMTSCALLLDLIMYIINIVNVPSCTIKLLLGNMFNVGQRVGVYLFIVFRSQIIADALNESRANNIWFKIGIILTLSSIGLIILNYSLILSGARYIFVFEGVCYTTSFNEFAIWQAAANTIIGSYCLLLFLCPLRMFIQTTDLKLNEHSKSTIKNVIIYSLAAVITTMLLYPLQMIWEHSDTAFAGCLFVKIDMIINVWCIVMQFSNLRTEGLCCGKLISCCRDCDCSKKAKKTSKKIVQSNSEIDGRDLYLTPQLNKSITTEAGERPHSSQLDESIIMEAGDKPQLHKSVTSRDQTSIIFN